MIKIYWFLFPKLPNDFLVVSSYRQPKAAFTLEQLSDFIAMRWQLKSYSTIVCNLARYCTLTPEQFFIQRLQLNIWSAN